MKTCVSCALSTFEKVKNSSGEWVIIGPSKCVPREYGTACSRCYGNKSTCFPLPVCMRHDVATLRMMDANEATPTAYGRFAKEVGAAINAYNNVSPRTRALLNMQKGIHQLISEVRTMRGVAPLEKKGIAGLEWNLGWELVSVKTFAVYHKQPVIFRITNSL